MSEDPMPRVFICENGAEFGQMRKLLDLSLRAVAGELGISQTELQRRERSSKPLDQDRLERWADAIKRAEMARVAGVRRATTARRYHRRERQEAESA
jgi:transcriptional regulator with XRE-family HTH domain